MYLNLYMCLHLVAMITIFVLPKMLRTEKRSISSTMASTEQTTNTEKLFTNNYNSVDTSDKLTTSAILTCNGIKITTNGTNSLVKLNTNYKKTNGVVKKEISHNNAQTIHNNQQHEMTQNIGDGCGSRPPPLDKHNLSFILREKFDSETRNIENFIDKTVMGIVELKEDLMKRQSDNNLDMFMKHQQDNGVGVDDDGNILRKRTIAKENVKTDDTEKFIPKELIVLNGSVRRQANVVLPAVISNGQAK